MSEFKALLASLSQQVISRSEEGFAARASSSRTQERTNNQT